MDSWYYILLMGVYWFRRDSVLPLAAEARGSAPRFAHPGSCREQYITYGGVLVSTGFMRHWKSTSRGRGLVKNGKTLNANDNDFAADYGYALAA
jgi:hypothetical protein